MVRMYFLHVDLSMTSVIMSQVSYTYTYEIMWGVSIRRFPLFPVPEPELEMILQILEGVMTGLCPEM